MVDVQAHDDFRGVEFLESVLDAVGDVGSHPHLRLHPHVGGAGYLHQVAEELASALLVLLPFVVVVDHVERHQSPVQLLVAHHQGHAHQSFCQLGVFHGQQYLLVVDVLAHLLWLVVDHDLLGGILGDDGADDAGEENHDHHAVEHVVVHQLHAGRHLGLHAHHHHGDGSGGMSCGEAAHHVPPLHRHPEVQAGHVGGQCLSHGAHKHHEEHHPHDVASAEEYAHVDEHAHADKEIGDEERVADELDAVHQRREAGDEPVEYQSADEGAQDALKVGKLGERGTEEHHREDEDKLHHRVGVAAQEPPGEAWYEKEEDGAEHHDLDEEKHPEHRVSLAREGAHHGGEGGEREKEGDHRRSHAQRHAGVLLQAIPAHDGVGH